MRRSSKFIASILATRPGFPFEPRSARARAVSTPSSSIILIDVLVAQLVESLALILLAVLVIISILSILTS
jgi:hypothetical protein